MTGSPLLLFMIQIIIKRSTWSITENPGLWAARKSWAEKQDALLANVISSSGSPRFVWSPFQSP